MLRPPFEPFLLALLLAPALASAQDETPKSPAQLDEVAQSAWDKWKKIQYHAGCEGLERVSFKLIVRIEATRLPKAVKTTGVYRFDRARVSSSSLIWKNPTVGEFAESTFWNLREYNTLHDPRAGLEEFMGCKLKGIKEGNRVRVEISGRDSRGQAIALLFDERGVLEGHVLDDRWGEIVNKFKYVEREGKFHLSGFGFSVATPKGEDVTVTCKLRHVEVEGLYLFAGATVVTTHAGAKIGDVSLEATNHKVRRSAKRGKKKVGGK